MFTGVVRILDVLPGKIQQCYLCWIYNEYIDVSDSISRESAWQAMFKSHFASITIEQFVNKQL